ncbi:Metallo-dependent phosphatase-like protein [Aspergillus multicolor]|uniref:Metallo-dependent phosphatase-like protein n=1 Tax=Aspergillus multicolor TaxID=41759 RepID=UPI003CCDA240
MPTGKLYAIADLHLGFAANKAAWAQLAPHPGDGLILCGDVGESAEHLRLAFSKATACFDATWWCPGNHELYTLPGPRADESSTSSTAGARPRGHQKYEECVAIAREYNVLTPEDEFVVWTGEGGPAVIAPIFTLYDYSFRPADVSLADAVPWAREKGTEATDEFLLHPDPYNSREEWCRALVAGFERKLEDAARGRSSFPSVQSPSPSPSPLPLVIANHWPLREDLVTLKLIPRFSLWCGTRLTEDWHRRFNASVVVSGHLHIRRTDWRDGCRFEEVSLGYPRQWKRYADLGMGVNELLREILPGPERLPAGTGEVPTQWGV